MRRGVSVGAVLALVIGLVVAVGSSPAVAAPVGPAASDLPGGSYVPLTPARVLDTRSGLGAPRGATARVTLALGGRSGVPTSGVGAVVLNLTVTGATGSGFLAMSPTGVTGSSNVNYVGGRAVAQLATSKVDDSVRVVLTSSSKVQVIADVVGWFTDPAHAATGATYRPATPRRLFDSRAGGAGGPLVGGLTRRIALTSVPAGATAVAVDLTTVRPTGDVYVTAWGSGARPGTSSMNVAKGEVRSNRAIVPIAPDRSISAFLSAGRADLVVDLSGWFTAGAGAAGGSRFVPLDPGRLLDSRDGTGVLAPNGWYEPLSGTSLPVAGRHGLPRADALIHLTAAWLNVTVVSSRWTGWTALAPTRGTPESAQPVPGTSDVNWGRGVTPNAVLATLGDGGFTSLTSRRDTPDVDGHPEAVIDLAGVFVAAPPVPAVGLWRQGRAVFTADAEPDSWNTRVPGATGDIVEVAGTKGRDGETAALRRDGTVLVWSFGATAPTVLTTDATHVAANANAVYVVKRDGTVWTDDTYPGAHGVRGPVSGFGPVTGVSDVRSIDVLYTGGPGVGVRSDGSVVAWGGTNPAVRVVSWLTGTVTDVALDDGGIACSADADGSVDVRVGSQDKGRATGVEATSVVRAAELAPVCYALDVRGRVHELRLLADHSVHDAVLDGPAAAAVVGNETDVVTFDGRYTPQVRVLATDGTVWDRVSDDAGHHWVHVAELDGAAAIGGPWSLVTWVPPGS